MNLNPRPRLWLTPARLTRLQSYRAQNTRRWQKCLAAGNAALTSGTLFNDGFTLALLYVLTGDTQYSSKAIALLAAYIASPGLAGLQGDSGYNYHYLYAPAAVYDLCHDQLAPAQVAQFSGFLLDACDWVWVESNPTRKGAWAVTDPANNYWTGFLETWLAALATYGDDPVVTLPDGTQGTRSAWHLALARNSKYAALRAYETGWGQGGVWAEGTGYDSTQRIGLILDAHFTATGENLLVDVPYPADSLLFRIHSTCPDLVHEYPLGDQPRQSDPTEVDYDRERCYYSYADVDPARAALAQWWLDKIPAQAWSFTAGWEFAFALEAADLPPVSEATLPTSYYAPGTGLLLSRSDWTPNATYWGFQGGPLIESHQMCGVNGFAIWKGGWLTAPAEVWSQSGIIQQTRFCNAWLFPSAVPASGYYEQYQGGAVGSFPPSGGTTLWQDGTSIASQAWPAYVYLRPRGGTKIVSDFRRVMVYVPSVDSFVVLDRVATASAAQPGLWPLHAQKPWTISGQTYSVDNGKYTLAGTALGPTPTSIVNTPIAQGPGTPPAVSSNRLDVLYPAAAGPVSYAHVLQVLPLGQQPRSVSATWTATTCTIRIGSVAVVLTLTDNPLTFPLEVDVASEVILQIAGTGKPVLYSGDGGPWTPATVSPAGGVDQAGLGGFTKVVFSDQVPSVNHADVPTLVGLGVPTVAAQAIVAGQPNWPSVAAALQAGAAALAASWQGLVGP